MPACPSCNSEIEAMARFCPECGVRLQGAPAAGDVPRSDSDLRPPETASPASGPGHGSVEAPISVAKAGLIGQGGSRRLVMMLIAGAIVAGLIAFLLIPAVTPIPALRDSDGDGVVDANDFWAGGDGGLRIGVEELNVAGWYLVKDGEHTCLNETICPSTSFRISTDVGVYDASYVTDAVMTLDIPDDNKEIAFLVEAEVEGIVLDIGENPRILSYPFDVATWTYPFSYSGLVAGNITYSGSATVCPCDEDYRAGHPSAAAWPPDPPTGPVPEAIGVVVSQSADGTNWSITLVDVPAGLSPSSTYLTVFEATGAVRLSRTALSSLSGDASFSQISPGGTSLEAGDRLLLSISVYPAGSVFQLTDDYGILAQGTLQ